MKKTRTFVILALLLMMSILLPAVASAATIEMAYGGGSLYLRTGPGREYDSNGTVHDGDTVYVESYGSIWSRVRTTSGRTGYVKNLYINDGDANYASGTSYFNSRYTAYTTASLNLRSGASTNTAIIRTLSRGTKLTVMGENGGFRLVQTADGTQGYVSSAYLSRSYVSGSSSSSSSSSAYTKTVSARSGVNLRADGGKSAAILRTVPYGAKVSVIYTGNYWTKVNYKGTVGWIKSVYLR